MFTIAALLLSSPADAGMSSSALVADMAPRLTVEQILLSRTDLEVATLNDRLLGEVVVLCNGGARRQLSCSVTASRVDGIRVTGVETTRTGGLTVDITDGSQRDQISIEPNPSP